MFDKRAILSKVKSLYEKDENLMQYLRQQTGDEDNSLEDIMIAYDFQAGSYIEEMNKDSDFSKFTKNISRELASTIKSFHIDVGAILEAGTGECTFLKEVIDKISVKDVYAFDISWSRIKSGEKYLGGENICLFVGDLFSVPLADNSMDIVFTRQSLEPNGGHERELLKELYRVSGKYLILQEPAFELASQEAQERMLKHGYVRGLLKTAKELDMKVLDYRLLPEDCWHPYNPVAMLIIEKNTYQVNNKEKFICPVTGSTLEDMGDSFFSQQSMLAYPKLAGIPMLLASSGIVATKYMKFSHNR